MNPAPSTQDMRRRPQTRPSTVELDENDEEFYLGGLFNLEFSPGFKFLESLRGKAPESMITQLESRMRSLHAFLLSCAEYEKSLIKRVKDVAGDVQKQRLEIDRTASKQFTENTEIGELKRELLKAENEVKLAQERESRLTLDISESQEKKRQLMDDIDEIRRHKADMLEPQLIASSKELKLEVIQRRHQVENLEKDQEEKDATYEMIMQQVERLEMDRERHAAAFSQANEMPQKIIKQSEVLRDAIGSLVIENVKQGTLSQQLDKELERLAKRRKDLEEHKLDQAAEYEQRRAEIHEMERQCDEIFKQHEMAKEQLAVQKGERVRLELGLKKCVFEIKREHDLLLRSLREKDALLKSFRRLETTVNNIRLSTPLLHQQLTEHTRQLEQTKRDERHYRKQSSQLRKEIDLMLYEYLKTENGERTLGENLAREIGVNQRLDEELEEKMTRAQGFEKQVEELNVEKELKARELIRIRNKLKTIKDNLGVKEISVLDASKRCQEAVTRLKEFATLYDVVKNERNKYLNQIQATTQRAAEMKEKIKILSNEIEILRLEIAKKGRELTKKRQENTAAYAQRDSAKNEANKLLLQYRERRDEIDQNLSRIETLQLLINAAESDLVALRTRHGTLLKTRNATGMQLLDRNDELCILYEKLNLQQEVMQRGDAELAAKDDEIRKLTIIASDLERQVELGKTLTNRQTLHETQTRLQTVKSQLDLARTRVASLSAHMETPESPGRTRDLGGSDPPTTTLLEKIRSVEETLAEKEERILEKDLVLEEVTTLTDRLKRQTMDGRTESHHVAAQVNDLSKRIKHLTKAMMARVSELAMHQAMAMGLYQEKCDKEQLLEEAKARLANGEPPTPEIEREFIRAEKRRLQHEKQVKQLEMERQKAVAGGYIEADDDFYIYNNIRTTAEPRPNAYIPDTTGKGLIGDLPIPKPYGGHAPFRPMEKGASMRFFRKPVIKPIEI
ncbi:uncharacterized protein SPPG_00275 [Spizellomyces punctatus DAOM BR117]|uniref:Cilia- and flagella-associated protein 58 central coiled coil domain-containing protein n=1 Tax=Spizellomyces punctatus (strain DAOM BR117) TaxID=645134 RepID=A0A0L0HUH8_SPIPD|nr:uncharacterized protein SPPG_00275 [Spizellomyces punctatus DAOM BR117]KND04550.1 hypothetical protein SPPG_00275 [Spizellomyces punctatus DAOM BR117]|eukprot:XP_016612589.1 hypothetical protein SPPG_00275 [Spizellomyces punctatus DAOM BR117]